MKRFIKNIFLFFLPVLLLCIAMVPFYRASVECGELKDLNLNIESQRSDHNVLIGLGYNEETAYYKLVNANYYKADVIALGTSRVMQFKKELFKRSFYNCGGAVGGNYKEYINFLKNLAYKPDAILLGLDQWVFNDAWNRQLETTERKYNSFVKITKVNRNTAAMLKQIVRDWMRKKWKFADLHLYPENIGFNGRIKDEGFMHDGSYYYGYIYKNPEASQDYQFADTFKRIETGTSRFEKGEHIDPETLAQLEALLQYCSENRIKVVGFLAPFAPGVFDKMIAGGGYSYLNEIEPACKRLFSLYKFELYNYTDCRHLKISDAYFTDGFHGSEVVYGLILQDMIRHNSCISQYLDQEKMLSLLSDKYDGLTFYNPAKRTTHYK